MPGSGRLSKANTEENVEKVTKIVLENHYTSLRELPREQIDILSMSRVAVRLVSNDLSFIQKHHRKTAAEDFISDTKNDPISIKQIITCDETWTYEYGGETSQQSSKWLLKRKPKQEKKM